LTPLLFYNSHPGIAYVVRFYRRDVGASEAPSRPGQPQVTAQTETSVTLTWDGPSWNGGSAVLQYVVERREMRGPRWVRVHKSAVVSPPYTVSDLLPASSYQFRIYAGNAVGLSEPSPMSKVIACVRTGQCSLLSFCCAFAT